MGKNQEIQRSEDKFKGLLNAMMVCYAEHTKLVSENTKFIDESSAEDLQASKLLVDKSKEITE